MFGNTAGQVLHPSRFARENRRRASGYSPELVNKRNIWILSEFYVG